MTAEQSESCILPNAAAAAIWPGLKWTLHQVVLALDADFVVSAGLHEKLSGQEASAALFEDVSIQHNVVVLPAFETESSLGLEKGGQIANLAQQGEHLFPETVAYSHCSVIISRECRINRAILHA